MTQRARSAWSVVALAAAALGAHACSAGKADLPEPPTSSDGSAGQAGGAAGEAGAAGAAGSAGAGGTAGGPADGSGGSSGTGGSSAGASGAAGAGGAPGDASDGGTICKEACAAIIAAGCPKGVQTQALCEAGCAGWLSVAQCASAVAAVESCMFPDPVVECSDTGDPGPVGCHAEWDTLTACLADAGV